MAKKKEEQKESRIPLGLTAKNDTFPQINFQQFFDLMRSLDALNNVVNFIKQENFNADNIRYYFEEDLQDAVDKEGSTILVKNNKGELVPQKILKPDFWDIPVVKE